MPQPTVPNSNLSVRTEDDVIYFSVTSDGTSGKDWIARLEAKGLYVECHLEESLLNSNFSPTTGVTTSVAVLKGTLFKNHKRFSKVIYAEAARRGFTQLDVETACLVHDHFSNDEIKALGLKWIVVMDGLAHFFGAHRGNAARWLVNHRGPRFRWYKNHGFAFAVSETQA